MIIRKYLELKKNLCCIWAQKGFRTQKQSKCSSFDYQVEKVMKKTEGKFVVCRKFMEF